MTRDQQGGQRDTADAAADDDQIEIARPRCIHGAVPGAASTRGVSATPRASFGTRPLAPVLRRDSAALAGGSKSNASKPALRRRAMERSGLENNRTRPSVNAITPLRSAARQAS